MLHLYKNTEIRIEKMFDNSLSVTLINGIIEILMTMQKLNTILDKTLNVKRYLRPSTIKTCFICASFRISRYIQNKSKSILKI